MTHQEARAEARTDRLVTLSEVSEMFRCPPSTFRRWPGFPRPMKTSRARNSSAYYFKDELVEFINRCAAQRSATCSAAHSAETTKEEGNSKMEYASAATKNSARWAVNVKQGTLFVAHADMFACPNEAGRWLVPDNMEFFVDHDEAKARADEIAAEIRKTSDQAPPDKAQPASTDDQHKLPHRSASKADIARQAKEKWGVTLHENRTAANVRAQYLAASVAHASGVNVQGSVDAQAGAEGDQIPVA